MLYYIHIMKKEGIMGGHSLISYEVQNHVRPNFATPMLYAKNYSKFHKLFL
jgi:hypothetical protein